MIFLEMSFLSADTWRFFTYHEKPRRRFELVNWKLLLLLKVAPAHQVFQAARGYDFSGLEKHYGIGKIENFIPRVGHVKNGDGKLTRKSSDEGQYLSLAGAVQRSEGFVHEQ